MGQETPHAPGQVKVPTPTRGVPVMLDRQRRFRFSLRTLEDITTEFGAEALTSQLNGSQLAKVLWYGLRHEDPELTPEMVEEMVDLEHLQEVVAAMTMAMGTKAPASVGPLVDGAASAVPAAVAPEQ